jgi:hypothetical protein
VGSYHWQRTRGDRLLERQLSHSASLVHTVHGGVHDSLLARETSLATRLGAPAIHDLLDPAIIPDGDHFLKEVLAIFKKSNWPSSGRGWWWHCQGERRRVVQFAAADDISGILCEFVSGSVRNSQGQDSSRLRGTVFIASNFLESCHEEMLFLGCSGTVSRRDSRLSP